MGDARAGLEFLQGTWRAEFRDMNIDRRLFTTEVEVTGNAPRLPSVYLELLFFAISVLWVS